MRIEIIGDPLFLQRPRHTKHGFYDPQFIAKKNFAHLVKEQYKDQPLAKPLSIDLEFYLKMPDSWSGKKKERMKGTPHIARKDLDNAIKANLDSLNGVLWSDDCIIYDIHATKTWASEGKTIIIIKEE